MQHFYRRVLKSICLIFFKGGIQKPQSKNEFVIYCDISFALSFGRILLNPMTLLNPIILVNLTIPKNLVILELIFVNDKYEVWAGLK